MRDDAREQQEKVALFRYGLIADLVQPASDDEADKTTLYERLRRKAEASYCIPGTRRTRVAVETLRDWMKAYKAGGFDALKPRPRNDIGSARSIPQTVVDQLVSTKDDHRDWSVALVIDAVKEKDAAARAIPLPVSTVHRLLSRAGMMAKRPESATSKDRRHFAYERAGELWMSDVMHGPKVFVSGRQKAKTYLIALLDDATRVIPFAAFALSENTAAFLPVFQRAIMRRGIPLRLYVDNGSAFRSHHLAIVCARLGITLVHARPYQPQGKGKQERFFRTVRMQLLPALGEGDFASVDALNRRLWTWVEGEYHQRPHKGLDGTTPVDAWAMRSSDVRMPGPEHDLVELFLFEEKRQVNKDRTVSLRGIRYEVDAALVGETVTLRFDPNRPGTSVDVWHKGTRVHTARVVDAYSNCFVKRQHGEPSAKASSPERLPRPVLRMRDLAPPRKEGT